MLGNAQLTQLQAAIFSNNIQLGDKLGAAKDLKDRIGLLDGEATILPVKDNMAPPEIPRILLKSCDERISLNIARSRVDLFFRNEGTETQEALENILPLIDRVLSSCQQILNLFTNRLGLVSHFQYALEESSNFLMSRQLLKSGLFDQTREIQINVLKRIHLEGDEINRWTKIRSARNSSDPEDDKAIIVEIDINTLPDRPETYGLQSMMSFFNAACFHAKEESDRVAFSLFERKI